MFVIHQDVAKCIADGKKKGGGNHDFGHGDNVTLHLWAAVRKKGVNKWLHENVNQNGKCADQQCSGCNDSVGDFYAFAFVFV